MSMLAIMMILWGVDRPAPVAAAPAVAAQSPRHTARAK